MTVRRFASASIALTAALIAVSAQSESLYREDSFRALASDSKAFRVGDAITVQVMESSSASSSTDTSTQRNNAISATLNHLPSRQRGFTLNAGGEFDGGGTTQRANRLLATLTVTVRDVAPNGELRIAGEQTLRVNEELHRVNLEGRVRPQDVTDGNVVLSTRLADARITYVGDGDLSERQRRGLWRSVMDWLGF